MSADEDVPEDKVMIWPAGVFHLTAKRTEPHKVLAGAIAEGLSEVLVLGVDRDGEHFAASSTADREALQALMDTFNAKIDGGEYIG